MSDYPAVSALICQVQQLHVGWRPDIYKPTDCPMTRERFAQIVEQSTGFIAEHDCQAVGYMEIMYRHVENPIQVKRDVLYIDTMAVAEGFRGQGVGHRLFETAKRIQAEKGLAAIELQVNARNTAAYEMYQKYGFRVKTYYMELIEPREDTP